MRCLLLRRNANSNANGVAEGRDFQEGESVSPDLKLSADWVQGNALPSRESRCKAELCPSESTCLSLLRS